MVISQGVPMKSMMEELELLSARDLLVDLDYSKLSTIQLPASRNEWEHYRPLITTLYIDMKMPLSELMGLMKEQYRFKATPRMYKQRFKDWHIYKYPKVAGRYNGESSPFRGSIQTRLRPRLPLKNTLVDINDSHLPESLVESSEVLISDPNTCDSSVCHHRDCVRAFVSNCSWEQLALETNSSKPLRLLNAFSFQLTSRSGCIQKVLHCVHEFSEWWTTPSHEVHVDPFSSQEAARITASIAGHCAHRVSPDQCERCTWAEFDYGLAMLELGQIAEAFASFELGCRLALLLLRKPSKLFIRNLFMAFGSNRWEAFEPIRQRLLSYLAGMSSVVLSSVHPITIILENTACGDILKRTAESSLKTMIEIFDKAMGPAHADVLLIKRSLSVVLRRQEDYEPCEKVLRSAIEVSEIHNGYEHKETRRCLRRLAHLYMQRGWWKKAEELCVRILETAPELAEDGALIPDEISVYTYQHLAVIANSMGDHEKCLLWFSRELEAAVVRWGPQGDYSAECIMEALLRDKQSPVALSAVVHNYPQILNQAWATELQGRFVLSKARWCAVRNLI